MMQPAIRRRFQSALLSLVLLLALPAVPLGVAGQTRIDLNPPRIVPQTPDAAVMQRFAQYPVNLSTGVPDITIPLYEITDGDIRIPITLGYHSSGLRPWDGSGIAGTGWQLTLEPVVSRQVRGRDDFDGYLTDNRFNGVVSGADDYDRLVYLDRVADGSIDCIPDLYFYRLLNGSSGSGYITDRSVAMRTSPVTNDVLRASFADCLTARDAMGFEYEFRGCNDGVLPDGSSLPGTVTSWHCTRVTSPRSGRSVTFGYHTIKGMTECNARQFGNGVTSVVMHSEVETGHEYERYRVAYGDGNQGSYFVVNTLADSVCTMYVGANIHSADDDRVWLSVRQPTGQTLYRSYPDIIRGTTFTAVVDYDDDGLGGSRFDRIGSVTVSDATGGLLALVRFHVTPYNASTTLTKLDSVSVTVRGGLRRTWRFGYTAPDAVPDIYTPDVDHWGFYNAAGNGRFGGMRRGIAVHTVLNGLPLHVDGVDRRPNANAAMAGVLSTVTVPEGVVTSFEHEGNAMLFSNLYDPYENYACYPVGGLRVRRITDRDPRTGRRLSRSYLYGLSSGDGMPVLWGGGVVPHVVTQADYRTFVEYIRTDGTGFSVESYHGMPVGAGPTFRGGSPVLYRDVLESVSGGGLTRTTQYRFNVPETQYDRLLLDFTGAATGHAATLDDLVDYITGTPDTDRVRGLFIRNTLNPQQTADMLDSERDPWALVGRMEFKTELPSGAVTSYDWSEKRLQRGFDVQVPVRRIVVDHNWYFNNPLHRPPIEEIYTYDDFYHGYATGNTQSMFVLSPERIVTLDSEQRCEPLALRWDGDSVGAALITGRRYYYEHLRADGRGAVLPTRVETVAGGTVVSSDDYRYLDDVSVDWQRPTFPGVTRLWRHTEDGRWTENAIRFREGTALPLRVETRTSSDTLARAVFDYLSYDALGNATSTCDASGLTASYTYSGLLPVGCVEEASPPGVPTASPPHATSLTWNADGTLRSLTAADQTAESYTYDGWGRLLERRFHDGTSSGGLPLGAWRYSLGNGDPPVSGLGVSGTPGAPHVVSATAVEPVAGDAGSAPVSSLRREVTYYDAFGDAVQHQRLGASPGGGDIVTRSGTDGLGRPSLTTLPTPMPSGVGSLLAAHTVDGASQEFYGDASPWGTVSYDSPHGDRVAAEQAPGASWQDHPVRHAAVTNAGPELTAAGHASMFAVRRYAVVGDSLTSGGWWPTGTLAGSIDTDADGRCTLTFRDAMGRTVLTRAADGRRARDTYYVYHGGLLRYVLPPSASERLNASGRWARDDATLAAHAYAYRYDARRLLSSKRLPGCAETLYAHDRAGREVLSQDGSLRDRGLWRFSAADVFGRPAVTGLIGDAAARGAMRHLADSAVVAVYTGAGGIDSRGYSISGMAL